MAEEKTYDILFELENELEIELGILPEVYYVGRNFSFNEVGMDLRREYRIIRNFKKDICTGTYLMGDGKILIKDVEDERTIGEEVGHFIHDNYLKNKGISITGISRARTIVKNIHAKAATTHQYVGKILKIA